MQYPPDDGRVVVLNPVSGSQDHVDRVRELASEHGFAVRTTSEERGAVGPAADAAAAGASLVAAAGGDGTVNEVVNGLYGADALPEVTVAVVPGGTGNNFASNVGVEGIEHAFEVIESGERREIDVGIADGRVFVNSCIGGITTDASAETTPEDKRTLGVMAYVLNTVSKAVSYEGLSLAVETLGSTDRSWSGNAAFVLVGNGRRFPVEGNTQANMEDGRFEVTIIEDGSALEVAGNAALERLFGEASDGVHRLSAPALRIRSIDGEPVPFSLDGEMVSTRETTVETRESRLTIPVGESYDPDPDPDVGR